MFEEIRNYKPTNEQEEVDKQTILNFMARNADAFLRSNPIAHMTASAIVVNEAMTKVLFAFHNIYRSWSWVGGHNDGDPDFLSVALREAKEETGVTDIRPYAEDVFMLDVIYVRNHVKHGRYVADHLHLNVSYLLIADEHEAVQIKHDENSGVRWFDIDSMLNFVEEERMIPVYQKAIDRIRAIRPSISASSAAPS